MTIKSKKRIGKSLLLAMAGAMFCAACGKSEQGRYSSIADAHHTHLLDRVLTAIAGHITAECSQCPWSTFCTELLSPSELTQKIESSLKEERLRMDEEYVKAVAVTGDNFYLVAIRTEGVPVARADILCVVLRYPMQHPSLDSLAAEDVYNCKTMSFTCVSGALEFDMQASYNNSLFATATDDWQVLPVGSHRSDQ